MITKNKDIFKYSIVEKYEAGIVLAGCEVKSIREKKISLVGSYCSFTGNELFILNMRIDAYKNSGYVKPDTERPRKLLLHKYELMRLRKKVEEKGYTIIPLSVYLLKSNVKIEIALATGKTHEDRRDTIKERDVKREMQRLNKRKS